MVIQDFTTRTIPLNELPAWSDWPLRLLALSEWQIPLRNTDKVDSEYDKDEYRRCLTFAQENASHVAADVIKAFELRLENLKSICVSHKGALYEMPADQIIPANNQLLVEALEPLMADVDTVVEIGCGYGFNLWQLHKYFPDKTYRGGEYSQNAVELASVLYKDIPQLTIEHCNFYDDTYAVLEKCQPNSRVLLFTRHAIEQIPTATKVLQALTQYFDRLVTVAHLEIIYENNDDSLLGLMRQRYAQINDYNRDLLGLLQARDDIEIFRNDPDEFGHNPLNPTSVLMWRPR
ncbi:MAG: class I SAM-dependent methyltransferase [Candidatus Peribacteraceae bacterium]